MTASKELAKAKAIVEKLNAPTPKEAIKTRPGKGKSGALRYVDARYVMERLDEAVGPFAWTDTYRETDGGTICTISLTLDGEVWIPKSDVGTPSNIEGVKGRYSDAFKRAAVKWGIGRDLYEDEAAPPEPQAKAKDAKSEGVVGGSGLSTKQKGLLFAKMKEHNITGDQRKALLFFIVGKNSSKDLQPSDLDKVLEFLNDNPETDDNETWSNIRLASAEAS